METMKKILLLYRVFALMTVLTCALGASAADTLSAASSLDNALNVAGGTIHFTSSGTYPWIVKESLPMPNRATLAFPPAHQC